MTSSPADARADPGWFFVLQEHPSEPRFGLEPVPPSGAAFGAQPDSWQALAWSDLAASAADLAALNYIDLTAALPLSPVQPDGTGAAWQMNGTPPSRAADLADITFRQSQRLAVHGSVLIPAPPPRRRRPPRRLPPQPRRRPAEETAHDPRRGLPDRAAAGPARDEIRRASLLQVRIFPDDIWADTHEPELTAQELADGNAYLAAKASGLAAEQAAWGVLVSRWTAPRAAWIASAVTAGSPPARAESWTRAAQALLPAQWVVRAYQGPRVYTVASSAVRTPLALTLSPASTPADQVPISDGLSIDAAVQWTVDFAAAQSAGMAVTVDLTRPDRDVPGSGRRSPGSTSSSSSGSASRRLRPTARRSCAPSSTPSTTRAAWPSSHRGHRPTTRPAVAGRVPSA